MRNDDRLGLFSEISEIGVGAEEGNALAAGAGVVAEQSGDGADNRVRGELKPVLLNVFAHGGDIGAWLSNRVNEFRFGKVFKQGASDRASFAVNGKEDAQI